MNSGILSCQLNKELAKRNRPLFKLLDRSGKTAILNAEYKQSNLHIVKAHGCFLEDASGNSYIDTALGAGTHILGHAHPMIVNGFKKQTKQGSLYILPNYHTYEVASLLTQAIPHFKSCIFCNSGTEATMRAVRIGRAYTGKNKIAMFGGGWHGSNDMLLFEEDYNSDVKQPLAKFTSAGIPDEIKNMLLMLPYNTDVALELITEHKNELAMVIVEPSQGSNPRDDVGDFLYKLRQVTSHNNILLCFDEIITGFRIALGGCQEYYNIEADIATYGKTIGGGVSIGMVAGKSQFMDIVKGDKEKKAVFMGGTFSANPLAMSMAKTVLEYLIKNQKIIYPYLNNNAGYIRKTLNNFCITNKIPIRIIGIGSMLRMVFTDNPIKSRRERDKYEISYALQNLFSLYLLLEKGVYVDKNRMFLSMAHKKKQVETIVQSAIETIEYFNTKVKVF